jgi:hypothetical protein
MSALRLINRPLITVKSVRINHELTLTNPPAVMHSDSQFYTVAHKFFKETATNHLNRMAMTDIRPKSPGNIQNASGYRGIPIYVFANGIKRQINGDNIHPFYLVALEKKCRQRVIAHCRHDQYCPVMIILQAPGGFFRYNGGAPETLWSVVEVED